MNRRRTVTVAALCALLLPLPLTAAGTSVAAEAPAVSDTRRTTPELPRPTGRFAVGQDPLHLVDRSRTDHGPGTDESRDRDWHRLDGWKRWISFAGSGHFTFTDWPAIGDQLGLPDPQTPLPGDRSVELTRRYVAAFFDRHLKGKPRPVLDGPSADAPEVSFITP